MCFLLQVYNFIRVKLNWKSYLKEKQLAKEGKSRTGKKRFKNFVKKLNIAKRFVDNRKEKNNLLYLKFKTEGTLHNYILMAVVGCSISVLFTFIYFYSELYEGTASVFWSFTITLPVFVWLSVMLAFTQKGRCYLCLAPLQLFSGKGQMYLKATMMLLVVEGPMLNLHYNINVIQESSACHQRGVATAAAEIADILFGPFSSLKNAAMEIVNGIKRLVEKLQNMLSAFKRTVMTVADAIQDATKWINSKINGCKNTVGTTYDHCMEAFSWMYDECKVSMPSYLVKMCTVTEFASKLCSSVKPGEYLCDLVYFNVDPLVTTINQRISRLMDRAYTLMYFSVNIHHEYNVESNSMSIADQLKEKLTSAVESEAVLSVIVFIKNILMSLFTVLFLWFIFQYRSYYFKRESFDNYFISKRLISLDIDESLQGMQSIFPLRRLEKQEYTKVGSYLLLTKEFKAFYFSYGVFFYTVIAVMVIGVDYVLFFITDKCREFMLAMMQSFGNQTKIDVTGSGFIAELSRRVVRALNYMDNNLYYTQFMPCMPNPKPPNSWTNKKIFFIMSLLWCAWVTQPYVLRLRHIVMDYYYPDMAERRVRWLYNSIKIKRITFVNLIRVTLRAKYGGVRKDASIAASIANMLRVRFPWMTYIIGKGLLADDCMICGHAKPPLFHCTTGNCMGIYCDDCYVNIQGYCSLCRDIMTHEEFQYYVFRKRMIISDEESADEPEGSCVVCDDLSDQDLDYDYQRGYAQHWSKVEELGVGRIQAREQIQAANNHTDVLFYFGDNVQTKNKFGHKYTRLQEGY